LSPIAPCACEESEEDEDESEGERQARREARNHLFVPIMSQAQVTSDAQAMIVDRAWPSNTPGYTNDSESGSY